MGYEEVRILTPFETARPDLTMSRTVDGKITRTGVILYLRDIDNDNLSSEVYFRIRTCLGNGILDSITLAEVPLDEVLVITSRDMSEGARRCLRAASEPGWMGIVSYWDEPILWGMFQRFLGPAGIVEAVKRTVEECSNFDDHYVLLPPGTRRSDCGSIGAISCDGVVLEICEKYPGSTHVAPFTFKVRATGDAALRLQTAMRQGGKVVADNPGDLEVDYPPLLKALLSEAITNEIHIVPLGSQESRAVPLDLSTRNSEGTIIDYEQIQLGQITKSDSIVELTNENQGLALVVTVRGTRTLESPAMSFKIRISEKGTPVRDYVSAIRFLDALQRSQILLIDSGAQSGIIEQKVRAENSEISLGVLEFCDNLEVCQEFCDAELLLFPSITDDDAVRVRLCADLLSGLDCDSCVLAVGSEDWAELQSHKDGACLEFSNLQLFTVLREFIGPVKVTVRSEAASVEAHEVQLGDSCSSKNFSVKAHEGASIRIECEKFHSPNDGNRTAEPVEDVIEKKKRQFRNLVIEGKRYQDKARIVNHGSLDFSNAARIYDEAVKVLEEISLVEPSQRLYYRLVGLYWAYEAQMCRAALHYQRHEIPRAKDAARRALELIEVAQNGYDPANHSVDKADHLRNLAATWPACRLNAKEKLIACDARAAWDEGRFLDALDRYTEIESVQSELLSLAEATGGTALRISRGNLYANLANKSNAIIFYLRNKKGGPRNEDVQFRCLIELFVAYTRVLEARDANIEWEEYDDLAVTLKSELLAVKTEFPDDWSKLKVHFGESPSLKQLESLEMSSQEGTSENSKLFILRLGEVPPSDVLDRFRSEFGEIEFFADKLEIHVSMPPTTRYTPELKRMRSVLGSSLTTVHRSNECLWEFLPEVKVPDYPNFTNIRPQVVKEICQKHRLLLLTATPTETKTVLSFLQPYGFENISRGTIDGVTYLGGRLGNYAVFLVESDMGSGGSDGSTMTVVRALRDVSPSAIIMIGISFGVDRSKQRLGDVLVATSIQPYELQKLQSEPGLLEKHIFRANSCPSSRVLSAIFRRRTTDWVMLRAATRVEVHHGLVLSGEKIINSPNFKTDLLTAFPLAIGGEMESAGAFAAALDNTPILLVKSICDWADGEKDDDAQPFAAYAAVSLCEHVLSQPEILADLGIEEFESGSSEQSKDDGERQVGQNFLQETSSPKDGSPSTHPTLFISYSWDDETHKDWVLNLAQDLRRDYGIDVTIDQFSLTAGSSLFGFMETATFDCEFLAFVCTEVFFEKANADSGGVGVEKGLATARFLDGLPDDHLIPILRSGKREEAIPRFLKGKVFVDFRDGANYKDSLEEFARAVYRVPRVEPAPLGTPRFAIEPPTEKPGESNAGELSFEIIEKYAWPSVGPKFSLRTLRDSEVSEFLYVLKIRILNSSQQDTSVLSLTATRDGHPLTHITPRNQVGWPTGSFGRGYSVADSGKFLFPDQARSVPARSTLEVVVWLQEHGNRELPDQTSFELTIKHLDGELTTSTAGIKLAPGREPE